MSRFEELIKDLNIKYNPDIARKLKEYYNFLIEYNSHTNLTSITDKESVYLKHFYDSILIARYIDLNNVSNLIDIGTGAGFPGMVIKIFYPDIDVTLLDSNRKKTAFLEQLASKLDIKVNIINERAEDYAKSYINKFDLVVSRAVAFIDIIASLTVPFIKFDGKVVLYKGNFDNEYKILKDHYQSLNIKRCEIINASYEGNERNFVILEKNSTNFKLLNYNEILKQNKKWRK